LFLLKNKITASSSKFCCFLIPCPINGCGRNRFQAIAPAGCHSIVRISQIHKYECLGRGYLTAIPSVSRRMSCPPEHADAGRVGALGTNLQSPVAAARLPRGPASLSGTCRKGTARQNGEKRLGSPCRRGARRRKAAPGSQGTPGAKGYLILEPPRVRGKASGASSGRRDGRESAADVMKGPGSRTGPPERQPSPVTGGSEAMTLIGYLLLARPIPPEDGSGDPPGLPGPQVTSDASCVKGILHFMTLCNKDCGIQR
jgi:hypothetical protein